MMERAEIEAHRKVLDAIRDKIGIGKSCLKGLPEGPLADWIAATVKVDQSVHKMNDLMLRKAEYTLLEIEFLEAKAEDIRTEVSVMTLSELKAWKEAKDSAE